MEYKVVLEKSFFLKLYFFKLFSISRYDFII